MEIGRRSADKHKEIEEQNNYRMKQRSDMAAKPTYKKKTLDNTEKDKAENTEHKHKSKGTNSNNKHKQQPEKEQKASVMSRLEAN